jgi:Phage integrase family
MMRNVPAVTTTKILACSPRNLGRELDVRKNAPPLAEGEVFFLDIPLYRTPLFGGALATALLEWRGQTPYSQPGDWVFASPKMNGKQPYRPETLLKCYVLPIAKRLSITKKIGWHTFRRTLATLLTGSDENAKTTQELMRHANAGITMNLYAQALTPAKRAAHLKVVEMIRPARGTASVPLCSRDEKGDSVSA